MHAHILTGGDATSRARYISDLSNPKTELIHLTAEKSTLTIKQIKDLWAPLSIAPRLKRIVWIEEANLLTIPAQNSLLKMLEEPPSGTTFYLTCITASSLLPTIRSRSSITKLSNLTNLPNSTILSELKEIMALSLGDRLVTITKRDRSESMIWISQIESALKEKLHDSNLNSSGLQTLAKIAHLAQDFHLQLTNNCSVSLATQNFYLLLPHTRSTS